MRRDGRATASLDWEWYNPGDLDRTGRCRECERVFTKPHAPGCTYGPGKVGALKRRIRR